MIKTFKDAAARELFLKGKHRDYTSIAKVALRKLLILEAATELEHLRDPPGNRLEALQGDREGQHSIRINDQFRLCFSWKGDGAYGVEIADYH